MSSSSSTVRRRGEKDRKDGDDDDKWSSVKDSNISFDTPIKSGYILTLSPNLSPEIVSYLTSRLKTNNLLLTKDNLAIEIHCTRGALEEWASNDGMLKMTTRGLMEPFDVASSNSFRSYNSLDFWLPCEEMALLWNAIDRISISEDGDDDNKLPSIFDSSKVMLEGDSLLSASKRMGWITDIVPMHDTERKINVFKSLRFKFLTMSTVVREYYGAEVALYFAWMEHLTTFLLLPGIVGALLWLHHYVDPTASIDNSMLSPIFTFGVIIWAAGYIQAWKRRCATLCNHWGLLHSSTTSPESHLRHEFKGTLRTNILTGVTDRYDPYRYQFCRFVGSSVVTFGMLCVALGVMILSLNLQGYIRQDALFGQYLYVEFLTSFSLPGAIFDQGGEGPVPLILPWIPVIGHSVTILLLNLQYREIAEKLTNWENHKTRQSYEKSLIIKRFVFEAFDCYIALFYLAFCQVDINLLRTELTALYMIDSVRRIFTESLMPLGLHYLTSKKTKVEKYEEILDEYEQFDDYMEIVISFGYVVLFAAAFPIASLLTIVCNIIEVKSDLFKLTYVVKRPFVRRSDTIGVWKSILTSLVWLSAVTNVFIFGITTDQMAQYFPSLYVLPNNESSFDKTLLNLGMGRWIIGYVFLLEHVLLLVVQLIFKAIPDTPEKIQTENTRRAERRVMWVQEHVERSRN